MFRSDWRELNNLNFARFDGRLEQRIADLRKDMETGFARFDVKLADLRSELLMWMSLFWVGNVATTVGVAVAVIGLVRR